MSMDQTDLLPAGDSGAGPGLRRRIPRRFGRPAWWAGTAALVLAVVAPPSAQAHGELLIRIAAVTRQIEATTNNPAQLYLERGELHREHLGWEEAGADYARAAQFDPNLAAVDFCRAKLLADSGQLEAARAMFDKVLARSPTDGEAFVGRARVLARLGQRQPAVADYRRGLHLTREPEPEYFQELAQLLEIEGKLDEAVRCLDDGIRKLGFVAALQSYALDLELKRGKHDAALVRLETILARAMRKETWLARRGDILLAAGRPAEAGKSFEASLETVKTLPLRIQQGPAMLNLQAHIHAALAALTNAPATGKASAP